MSNLYSWYIIAVIALVTAAIRFLPFIIFNENRKIPKLIEQLGQVLPYAIMGMLVVYCLKDIQFESVSNFLPELIACAAVSLLYIWKRNTLLSIVAGTLCYMFLVQIIF